MVTFLLLVLTLALLIWKHYQVRERFETIFGTSLGLRAGVLTLDSDLEYLRLAERVEAFAREQATIIGQAAPAERDSFPQWWRATEAAGVPCKWGPCPDSLYAWQPLFRYPVPVIEGPGPERRKADRALHEGWSATGPSFPKPDYGDHFVEPAVQVIYGSSLTVDPEGAPGTRSDVDMTLLEQRLTGQLGALLAHGYDGTLIRREEPEAPWGKKQAWKAGVAWIYCATDLAAWGFPSYADDSLLKLKSALEFELTAGHYEPRRHGYESWRGSSNSAGEQFQRPRALAYTGYPRSKLPEDYHPVEREWFRWVWLTGQDRWLAAYGDAGTGLPVLTFATPIRDRAGSVCGVLAVDYFVSALTRRAPEGRPILANLLVIFVASLTLLAILYASGRWSRLRLLFLAVASWLPLYLWLTAMWVFNPQGEAWERASVSVEVLFSLLNSACFLVAGIWILNEHARKISAVNRSASFLKKFLSSHEPVAPFFLATASSLVVWIVIVFWTKAFANVVQDDSTTMAHVWVDAILSFIAMVVFGSYFMAWCSVFARSTRFVYIAGSFVFYGYALLQLGYPLVRYSVDYLWVIFLGKVLVLGAIVGAAFSESQNYNFVRRQLGRITMKIYSRPLGEAFLLAVKEGRPDSPVLFASELAWERLGLGHAVRQEAKGTKGDPVESVDSIFGELDYHEPAYRVPSRRFFAPGELPSLRQLLDHREGDRGVQIQRGARLRLLDAHGKLVVVDSFSVARWKDEWVEPDENYLVILGCPEDEHSREPNFIEELVLNARQQGLVG